MPLQNRVTPFGEIVAVEARGTLMGNRGCLHNDQKRIVKSSARDAWVTCWLQWKGIRRTVMTPGKYTELFFLDEATALAAGHRPCNDCRSERLQAFQRAWVAGLGGSALVKIVDPVMKRDRGSRAATQVPLGALPDGVMVTLPGEEGQARLLWRGRLLTWTPAGYVDPRPVHETANVTVLTPACTVKVLGAGYVPEVHLTAIG